MTNYPTKYLFIAETQGIKQAAADLNALAAAMSKVNASSGGGSAGGGSSSFGPGKTAARDWDGLGGYVEKFGHRMRSALAYSLAFGAIGATFGAIGASVRTWVDAQVQLNDVIANTAILLGRTAQEGEQFANVQRSLSFATGQTLAELAPASMMAERVGQPELATSAAQWSMVVGPQLNASETVDDLRALSIQFGISMDEINNGLLATLQNSGIAADQLFDLSASFGVFAGQLGLGETERDLREIAGLFAALSNITGQTTPTLQNFVRRMADEFYDPNAALRQQLEAAGIQTVTKGPVTTTYDRFGNASQSFEEIRRPFTEIFAEIAQKGPAAIKQFSTAIDNSLGQPTQSQFILVAENWDKVSQTIGKVVTSTADFSDAVSVASDKLQTSLDRISIGVSNFLSVVGDGNMLKAALDTIGSAFQNTYDALRDPDAGMRKFSRKGAGEPEFLGIARTEFGVVNAMLSGMEGQLDRAYGGQTEFLTRRLHEILRVIEVPEEASTQQGARYAVSAIQQFMASDYVRPGDNSTVGAQQFQRFIGSGDFDQVDALRAMFPALMAAPGGDTEVDRVIAERFASLLDEIERASVGFVTRTPSFAGGTGAWTTGLRGGALVSGPIQGPSFYARNQMLSPVMSSQFGFPFQYPTVTLPEDITPKDFDQAYDEVTAILSERFGPSIMEAEVELLAFRDATTGLTVALGAYNAENAAATVQWLQATGENTSAADNLTTGFYNLSSAAAAAAGGLSAILSRGVIELPSGMTAADYQGRYDALAESMGVMFPGQAISDQEPKPYIFANENTGILTGEGANFDPLVKAQLDRQLAAEEAASARSLAEQKAYQNKALSAQEAYQNKMLGAWNGMINDLLRPSAVTGTDLFYNSPRGTYNDNWDEPVRRMKADINNAIGGKPLEYGYGGLTPYMNMDAVNMAMGATQEIKEAILRSEEARVSEQFYNMELPWEAYSGNTDAIVANAQAWIARKQQKNANMANVQQLLIDAGLGPDAEAFVKAMEEPPILQALFGGKSSDEINTAVTDAVTPDMTTALAKQAANTSWSLTIATAIQNDVTNNYEVVVAAGAVIGSALAKGSAAQFAAAIIPLVLAAITGRE